MVIQIIHKEDQLGSITCKTRFSNIIRHRYQIKNFTWNLNKLLTLHFSQIYRVILSKLKFLKLSLGILYCNNNKIIWVVNPIIMVVLTIEIIILISMINRFIQDKINIIRDLVIIVFFRQAYSKLRLSELTSLRIVTAVLTSNNSTIIKISWILTKFTMRKNESIS